MLQPSFFLRWFYRWTKARHSASYSTSDGARTHFFVFISFKNTVEFQWLLTSSFIQNSEQDVFRLNYVWSYFLIGCRGASGSSTDGGAVRLFSERKQTIERTREQLTVWTLDRFVFSVCFTPFTRVVFTCMFDLYSWLFMRLLI